LSCKEKAFLAYKAIKAAVNRIDKVVVRGNRTESVVKKSQISVTFLRFNQLSHQNGQPEKSGLNTNNKDGNMARIAKSHRIFHSSRMEISLMMKLFCHIVVIRSTNRSPAGFGDLNGDDVVDDTDVSMISSRWNVCEGDEDYDKFFDFDEDRCVTVIDIMKIVNSR